MTGILENKEYVLIETREDTAGDIITETSHDGKKLYLTGVFAQSEIKNGNGRLYPRSVMEGAVGTYEEKFINRKQAIGELNHPKNRLEADPKQAAVLVESVWWEGNNVMGRAIVPDTTNGKEVRALMEAGWKPGVSSRASGSLKKRGDGILEVQSDLKFHAIIDVVHNPSAPDAYVSGIYECTETGLTVVVEDKNNTNIDTTKYSQIPNSDSMMRFARKLIVESCRK